MRIRIIRGARTTRAGSSSATATIPITGTSSTSATRWGWRSPPSDTLITSRRIRRIALGQTYAAFIFNLEVIAFAVGALGG